MTFRLNKSRLKELAEIEEASNRDIGAGVDWGQNLDRYFVAINSCIDSEKLMAVLKGPLATVLSQEELEEIACSFQDQLQARVIQKLQLLAPSEQ